MTTASGYIRKIFLNEDGYEYDKVPTVAIGTAPTGGTDATAVAITTSINGVDSVKEILLINPGAGYTFTSPPDVIISLPQFKTEKITSIDDVQGFTGIITGISSASPVGAAGTALKFFFRADKAANSLQAGYPVFITDTNIGNGIISVDGHNSSVVAIGSTFLDNIYKVHAVSTLGQNGEIVCNIATGQTTGVGYGVTGNYNASNVGIATHLGRITWGRIFNATRSSNPISIGVTGLTVNSGLTTFPTIQRKNYSTQSLRGLRSTGAIRAFGL